MSSVFSEEQYRRRISDLIAEAVVESDDARRHSLLWMADEWISLQARRLRDRSGPLERS